MGINEEKEVIMLYLGIDYHKRWSYFTCEDEGGRVKWSKKVRNDREEIEGLLNLEERYKVVLECGRNWGVMYDTLEDIGCIEKLVLANPFKTKAIAYAKIKTDKIDSKVLCDLLRANLIPLVWVPPKDIRWKKYIARNRAFLVSLKTMIKNRIHVIIDRNHLNSPSVSDIFGRYGRQWLYSISLPEEERRLLDNHLKMLEFLEEEIKGVERWLKDLFRGDRYVELLNTIPGIGKIFGVMIALEIGDINRFPDAKHLHSYAGLVPSTYASGNKVYHGRLIKYANKWLRWAFVEATLTAIRVSPFFRSYYERRLENKSTQASIISTARMLASVTYHVLKENREYREW